MSQSVNKNNNLYLLVLAVLAIISGYRHVSFKIRNYYLNSFLKEMHRWFSSFFSQKRRLNVKRTLNARRQSAYKTRVSFLPLAIRLCNGKKALDDH